MPASGVFSRRNTLRFTSLGILSLAVIPMLTACGKDYQGEVKLDSYDESAGSYEPATKEHPAQNVPKPKKPQDINDDSTGGLYCVLEIRAIFKRSIFLREPKYSLCLTPLSSGVLRGPITPL